MTFPKLYQKTNTGAINEWEISVESTTMTTTWGQVGGKMQITTDTIKSGKNTGKKNATTPEQQAETEAKSRWEKQKKKGYVQSIEAAEDEQVDTTFVQGGIEPMLAPNKSYPKDNELQKRIVYPCFIQPKLDGMRCIAIIEDGKCTLWSRSRKPILSVPHINAAWERLCPKGKYIVDGELYNHEYRNTFEDLISILRKDEPDPEGLHLAAEHHIYDMVTEGSFRKRYDKVTALLAGVSGPLIKVLTFEVENQVELVQAYESFLVQEYEGAMARSAEGSYEQGKRSHHLQKMKEFSEDTEFDIIGANEGRGKDSGTVGAFICRTNDGKVDKEFKCRLKASYARRKELWECPEMWRGKKLTVVFKRWTSEKIPYLPVGKGIRDYEEQL